MPDTNAAQPTIPVKKQDGSVVRMTLDELKRYKAQQDQPIEVPSSSTVSPLAIAAKSAQVRPIPKVQQPSGSEGTTTLTSLSSLKNTLQAKAIDARPLSTSPNHSSQSQNHPPVANLSSLQSVLQTTARHAQLPKMETPSTKVTAPVVSAPHALATTTPVKDVFVAEAAAHEWKKDDALSPLDDSLHTDISQPHTPVSAVTAQQVDRIIARSHVTVDASLTERFRLAIIAQLKGIRSSDQTRSYLTLSANSGGLGLSDQQANDVIKNMLVVGSAPRIAIPQEDAPRIVPSAVPPRPHYTPLHQPLAPRGSTTPPPRQSSGIRPILQDIQKTAEQRTAERTPVSPVSPKQTVGPIDEIARLRLIDFRRFSREPQQAAEQLLKKFDTLKKESYLLFLDAKKAWWHSPLFQQYVQLLVNALHANTPITGSYAKTADAETLTQEEFQAIVSINTKIG